MILVIPASLQPLDVATIQKITKGGVFGWSALVVPHISTASAICAEPTKVLATNGNELESLFDKEHHLGYKVMKGPVHVICTRLREIERLTAVRKFTLP